MFSKPFSDNYLERNSAVNIGQKHHDGGHDEDNSAETGRQKAESENYSDVGQDKTGKSESDDLESRKLKTRHRAGNCALALSELMSKLDFHLTVFDDRPDLNTLQKNEFAHRIEIIESYEKIGELIDSDRAAYVVVMTLGYKFDEIVIRQLFDKDFKYFGVLGSKAKMKTLLKSLEKDGFDKKRLANIHTPIGIKINSRTPEEIAVSIAAEIIAVKNKSA